MSKVIVFQHVPYEPLGTLDPMLRQHCHRVKYVNFGRVADLTVRLEKYDGLIVLGGPMNVGESEQYPHLLREIELIQQAISLGIPVLGICLGAQLIAAALGAAVYPATSREIGWYRLARTREGRDDPLTRHFRAHETIFQWHGWTFDLPTGCRRLVTGEYCENQAFVYGKQVYGFQFHLEVNPCLLSRWLSLPEHLIELGLDTAPDIVEAINSQSEQYMPASLLLSKRVFSAFISLLPGKKPCTRFTSR